MRLSGHHVLCGKMGAAAGGVVLRKMVIARRIESVSIKERVSYFSEAIGIDQQEAIHKGATGVARKPGVFRRGELIACHGEKDQEKHHHQSAPRRLVEHLAHARQ